MATVAYPDQPAFPVDSSKSGMTVRHYFAALAMQALISKQEKVGPAVEENVAKKAVKFADALIEELGKEPE